MIFALVIFFVCAYFYEAARKRNNKWLMNFFIGVASFLIGGFVSTLIGDVLEITLSWGMEGTSEVILRLAVLIACVSLTYWGLKSVLNPNKKTVNNTSLDSDLTPSKEETEQ